MPTFEYYEPESVEEALSLLARYGDDAKVLAGGQSLIVLLRQRLVSPACLVSLHRIPRLSGVAASDGGASIGAMATYRELMAAPLVRERYGALAQACALVGPIPVQNVGTVGGSICHNAPGADAPSALLALDAHARVVGPQGERSIPLTDFFKGFYETVLKPRELLMGLTLPPPPPHALGAYLKFNFRLIDMALVGVAVALALDGDVCRHVRIALGGISAVPFRAVQAESALQGRPLTSQAVQEAAHLAAQERELISDVHCSAAYRKKVIPPLVRRAFQQALSAGGVPLRVV